MAPSQGYVTTAEAVAPERVEGDTGETRLTIDSSAGCELLEQRIVRFAPGRSQPRRFERVQEVLYVAEGRGIVLVERVEFPLEPDTGVYVAPGESYQIENPGPDVLVVVSVRAPASARQANGDRRVTVRYAEQPPLPASPNREFRYLVNQDAGCPDVTQFVGLIPPGRAPLHSHTYDEVIYVIECEGVLHLGGNETPIGVGTCIHLPPLVRHSLENTGSETMRVLGVFHPSGDPASRADEANQ